MSKSLKILIAPLDWGLGHTTRCFPIVKALLEQHVTVYMAASGASATLIARNFPSITILPIDGYDIRYSRKRSGFAAKIILQIPKLLRAVKREQKWLQQQQQIHQFDAVISDNRYGLHATHISTVVLTHQLQILSGWSNGLDNLLRKLHYKLLNRFDECWVVDKEKDGISGKLAHPKVLPVHARYMGILSQFMTKQSAIDSVALNQSILLLLSGPEPMRTMFEQALLQQVLTLPEQHFILVAGNVNAETPHQLPSNLEYHAALNADELLPILQGAKLVICRSGYTTIMDLCVVGKKAVLVPTPGQSEQEYLAKYLSTTGKFTTMNQSELNLKQAIMSISNETIVQNKKDNYNELKSFVIAFLKRIRENQH